MSNGSWVPVGGPATRVLLLRHGQTHANVNGQYSGRSAVQLTDTGVAQAAAMAERIAAVYPETSSLQVSPLARTRATAAPLAAALGLDPIENQALLECDFGLWEGKKFSQAASEHPDEHQAWMADPAQPPPGGESFVAVRDRIGTYLDTLRTERAGQTIALVSHAVVVKTALWWALDAGPAVLYRLHLDTASLTVLDLFPDGNNSVRVVNDTAHLQR